MMIELSSMHIDQYNSVIEARKKVYCLMLDLELKINDATRLATLVSEVLHGVLLEQKSTTLKLVFTKQQGRYYLHIYIASTEETYQKRINMGFFHEIHFCTLDDKNTYMEPTAIAMPISFIPSDTFMQAERERLIQHSKGEMLQEIRKKNIELNKALQDLKTSSDMIQSEKMRALGSMTAGVAHELNNPMMGILNFIQYAIKHTDEKDRRYQPLTDALREVNRCQDIITNLLTFSRMKAEGEEEFSKIKPSVLFARILKLLAYKINSINTQVIKHFPKNEPEIRIKINKMQQVILNLISNAIDAMKSSDKRELTMSIVAYDDSIALIVSDTGIGMDEETLDKIFEPFFTTKQAGEGTGLGLAVSKSIIEEHNGSISCKSSVSEGTSFTILLPIK